MVPFNATDRWHANRVRVQRRATYLVPELCHLLYEERLIGMDLPLLQYWQLALLVQFDHDVQHLIISVHCNLNKHDFFTPVLMHTHSHRLKITKKPVTSQVRHDCEHSSACVASHSRVTTYDRLEQSMNMLLMGHQPPASKTGQTRTEENSSTKQTNWPSFLCVPSSSERLTGNPGALFDPIHEVSGIWPIRADKYQVSGCSGKRRTANKGSCFLLIGVRHLLTSASSKKFSPILCKMSILIGLMFHLLLLWLFCFVFFFLSI